MSSVSPPTDRREAHRESRLGLDDAACAAAVAAVQPILADHLMLYLAYKTHHWTVTGPHFRDLHLLFDGHADDVLAAVDPLAERIVALGGIPLIAPSQLVVQAHIGEPSDTPGSPRAALEALAAATDELVVRLRGAIWAVDAAGDPGTSDLLTDVLRKRENEAWILSALLSPGR